jgi:glucose/arabinose dehydrogenase
MALSSAHSSRRLRSGWLALALCCCAGAEPAISEADGGAYDAYVSDPKLSVSVFASGLGAARQMAFASNGDLFVNNGKIVVLWDADQNGVSDANERAEFGKADALNHGLAFDRKQAFLYASSDSSIYRFAYAKGQRRASGAAELVIKAIPTAGHSTRTLAFDSQGRLYVSVGSAGNVDTSQSDRDTRSQIRRFVIPAKLPAGGMTYASGSVLASGLRNEVGLFVDSDDKLWGVENGRDQLSDAELGGDIHNDNPGEEINLFDGKGASFYGYPLCFSEYKSASGKGAGTQWADETLTAAMRQTDEFCRDETQVHPPAFSMQAHWAPLGVLRYSGTLLPFAGDLLIAAHGSWNREPAVGRLIARAHIANGAVVSVEPIVGEKNAAGQLVQGRWNARPVDVQQGSDGVVYFSDDQGGRVFKLGYSR